MEVLSTSCSETGVDDDKNITTGWSLGELRIHENNTKQKDYSHVGRYKVK